MLIGASILLYELKKIWPLLFVDDPRGSMVPIDMFIKPTIVVALLYLGKVLYDRWTRAARAARQGI
jgi:hypothetical protein